MSISPKEILFLLEVPFRSDISIVTTVKSLEQNSYVHVTFHCKRHKTK